MTKCLKCKDMMIEALYGELGEGEKRVLDRHLSACKECASEYSVLGATLRVMDARKRPDPGPEFWDGYWDRLARRMEAEAGRDGSGAESARVPWRTRIGRIFSSLPRWSYQAAGAAALLFVGILIGRVLLDRPGTPVRAGLEGGAKGGPASLIPASDVAATRAFDYFERSKVLLLGLVNYEPGVEDPYALDLPRRKEESRGLVSEAADIKGSLTSPGQARLRELVSDLEVILLQIANLEAGQDLEAVDIVKQGVEQTGLFLKIDLTQMARDARGPAPKASGPSDKPKV